MPSNISVVKFKLISPKIVIKNDQAFRHITQYKLERSLSNLKCLRMKVLKNDNKNDANSLSKSRAIFTQWKFYATWVKVDQDKEIQIRLFYGQYRIVNTSMKKLDIRY